MIQTDSAGHLRRSGAAISGLIAGLSADDLAVGDGRVARFAQIAIRHADNHRTDIQAPWPPRPTRYDLLRVPPGAVDS